ncbi:MAG TPA: hypothetical protein VG917_04410 [Patescibacteria group bacterium]|nr:hypothetical protein [Patescibacteria group bacterium]
MPDDIETHLPSQNEVEKNLAELKARAQAAFPDAADISLEESYRDIESDPDNFFATGKSNNETIRAYYDYQTDLEDGDIIFKESSASIINFTDGYINFYKIGRKKGNDSLNDTEHAEDECLTIKSDKEGKAISYIFNNPKGNDYRINELRTMRETIDNPDGADIEGPITNITISYGPDGNLSHFWPPQFEDFFVNSTKGNSTEEVDQYLKDPNQDSISFRIIDTHLDITYKKTDDEHLGVFNVIIKDQEGKPRYRLQMFRKIDPEEIADALDFDQLLAHPDQPANGIVDENGENRRSWGDLEWRRASFPDLTGIHITPLDI